MQSPKVINSRTAGAVRSGTSGRVPKSSAKLADMPQSNEIIRNLGPLAALIGVWEGSKGDDTAPSDDRGVEKNAYREHMTFEPLGVVNNHEQTLYGLKYSTRAWRLDEENSFHEELGYWLWDAKEKQVLRSFMIPRGVTVLAGGTVEPDAHEFRLAATVGSSTYGICSNLFLDREFKTVRYELTVKLLDRDTLSYEEDTQLKMKGVEEIFHHRDRNVLKRVQ